MTRTNTQLPVSAVISAFRYAALCLVLMGLGAPSAWVSPEAASPSRVVAGTPEVSPVKRKTKKDSPIEEDLSFLERVNSFYSIYLDSDLEPEVQSKVLPLWITSICCGQCCGPLWIPMIWVGEDPGDDYFFKEAVFLIIAELLVSALGGATTTFGIGAIISMANLLYLTPVGIINGYDRALKRQRRRTANRKRRDARAHAAPPVRALAMSY